MTLIGSFDSGIVPAQTLTAATIVIAAAKAKRFNIFDMFSPLLSLDKLSFLGYILT
jgi:hypothetical protein